MNGVIISPVENKSAGVPFADAQSIYSELTNKGYRARILNGGETNTSVIFIALEDSVEPLSSLYDLHQVQQKTLIPLNFEFVLDETSTNTALAVSELQPPTMP